LAGAIDSGLNFGLCSLANGSAPGAENAIALRAEALISLENPGAEIELKAIAGKWEAVFKKEFRVSDPGVRVELRPETGGSPPPLTPESRDRLLAAVRLMPLGLARFVQEEDFLSRAFGERLVETSNNLGIVETQENESLLKFMARGSLASSLEELKARFEILAALVGGRLTENSYIAGWEMDVPPSRIQKLFSEQGWKLFGVHAGLECGTIAGAMAKAGRHLEAISIGPDVIGAHTTQERLGLSSVAAFWQDLTTILAKL